VPTDSFFLLSVRIADLWSGELIEPVRKKVGKDLDEITHEFATRFGLPPEQIERLTIVIVNPPTGPTEPLLFVRTTKAYNRDKLIEKVSGKKAKAYKYKGQTVYGDNYGPFNAWFCYPLDDQSMVYSKGVGPIYGWIDHPAPKSAGNLADVLRLAAGKHSLTLGLDVKALNDAVGNKLPGETEPFKPLLEAISATLTVDLMEQSRAVVTLNFPTDKDAEAGVQPLKDGLDLAVAGLDRGLAELRKREKVTKIIELIERMRGVLKAVKIEREGKTLLATAHVKIDAATVGVAVTEAMREVRTARARTQSQSKLKHMGLAMLNYHDTQSGFPPYAIYDKNGKPLLSWRVMILPYLEQQDLYNQFHLDEPWDSAHNKKLLAKMPKVYASHADEKTLKDHTTHYQGFVGKGAFFQGKKGIGIRSVTDGLSNTLMIVEASKAVPWTKPEDLVYDPDKPLPELGLPGADKFEAGFGDGSVREIAKTIKPETLHALITLSGGEVINDKDF
jgi:hypothetical protein